MKRCVFITTHKGPVKLTYCAAAVRHFCKRMKCGPDVPSMLDSFKIGQQLEAVCAVVQVGYEQTLRDAGLYVPSSDYEICELMETTRPEEAHKLMQAFFLSVPDQYYLQWIEQQGLSQESSIDIYALVNASHFGELSYN